MNSLMYKWIWLILHTLVNVSVKIFHIGLEIFELIEHLYDLSTNTLYRHVKYTERRYIEWNSDFINKKPRHLAVILHAKDKEDVDLRNLLKLVEWSLWSGVNYLTFYDYKGNLKNNDEFRCKVEKLSCGVNDNIVWGRPLFSNFPIPKRNGFRRFLIVNIFSSDDGQRMFKSLMTEKLTNVKSEDLTCNLIDDEMSDVFGQTPDPDLALYFGNSCCTQGFLPWQIRLTEFLQFSHNLNSISARKFIKTLRTFGRCEQRFGK